MPTCRGSCWSRPPAGRGLARRPLSARRPEGAREARAPPDPLVSCLRDRLLRGPSVSISDTPELLAFIGPVQSNLGVHEGDEAGYVRRHLDLSAPALGRREESSCLVLAKRVPAPRRCRRQLGNGRSDGGQEAQLHSAACRSGRSAIERGRRRAPEAPAADASATAIEAEVERRQRVASLLAILAD